MQKSQQTIGVFDSGMGGLTVLRALRQELPQESFIYLGDTARLPYGIKSPSTIQHYAVQMARLLVERNIKALVIACNTATTTALAHLQNILPDLPILGVVAPGAQAAASATKNQKIVVLATETTIASQAYQKLITAALPNVTIKARACSLLVALAEEGMTNNVIAKSAFEHYLSGITDEDTILLACTHFPVFTNLLSSLLPQSVAIVDSAAATATALRQMLIQHALLNTQQTNGSVNYLVTDSINRFQKVGEIFLGEPLSAQSVELVDLVN